MPDRLAERVADLDWNSLQQSLDEYGYAKLPVLLNKTECEDIIDTYEAPDLFRSTIDMARYIRIYMGKCSFPFRSYSPSIKEKKITRAASFYWWNSGRERKAEVTSLRWNKARASFSQLIIAQYRERAAIIEQRSGTALARLSRGQGIVWVLFFMTRSRGTVV